ncbi:MAG: TonB-dependent receptor [Novosphingobium sp.]|nr:TonB-dependent receptor [Novosphingobium sp.]MCP5401285.1 TonB-dependent receptor [Novosphingobium sp.]
MKTGGGAGAAILLAASLCQPGAAFAQRATEDAIADADDAFGTTVGVESTGIYTQSDTRGFSPKKAGNARIDGIYFDQVASLSGRLRQSTAIRVGFSAEDYPFPAPTGIVDDRFHPMPDEPGASLGLHRFGYWAPLAELDIRLPLVEDHIALTGGASYREHRMTDGSYSNEWRAAVRPIFRFAHTLFAPFVSVGGFPENRPPTLVVVSDDYLPKQPRTRVFLGQRWAKPEFHNINTGGTLKSRISEHVVLRGGAFYSGGRRDRNFAEIYSLKDPSGLADHLLIADPEQDVYSTSGEAQAVYLIDGARWKHRIYVGYRARNRMTESGGSDYLDFGEAIYGIPDPQPEVTPDFSPVNRNRIRQSAWMVGYIAKADGLGTLNLGLQKARYRARVTEGVSGDVTRSKDDPWLYNATLGIDASRTLQFYIGTQRGLEDSGTAPETAANSREQLPATRTTQYEGGVRWLFHGGQLVVNAFQIAKPYFSFDADAVFTRIGKVRHRGVEASLSGHFGKRLNLLAGAVLMRPRVSGVAVDEGLSGKRPAGTPSVFVRVDGNYRTDIFGGLTPTATLTYTGKRAVGARPLDPEGHQLSVPDYVTLDLGLRQHFTLGSLPTSIRAVVHNVFDEATWDVVAANTLKVKDRRYFSLSLTTDF